MIVYCLDPCSPGGTWTGFVCTWARGRYVERRVIVPDLAVLPREARVYVDGRRWVAA